jgi:hypothetical protein
MEYSWYREKAADCVRSALTAVTDTNRAALEQEGRHWIAMAENVERREAEAGLKLAAFRRSPWAWFTSR